MKILFFGAAWKGSSARSLREAIALNPEVEIDEIGEDQYAPIGSGMAIKIANRLLIRSFRTQVQSEILRKIDVGQPDVLLVYKGNLVTQETISRAKRKGVVTVNVFPDCSPHAHGKMLKKAIGEYDLVISTKPFHRKLWQSTYGYTNSCEFVPHGYDPHVHYWGDQCLLQDLDVVMVASWRPLYEQLLTDLATQLNTSGLKIVVAGSGWESAKSKFPGHWQFPGGLLGKSYGQLVRRSKIVIAPVQTEIIVDGKSQPGDEDTTRTYELAASRCFFLHRRTPYVESIYSEDSEVPMWDGAAELVKLIQKYLPLDVERHQMAANAHRRAVPAYSIPERAKEILHILRKSVATR